MAIQKTFKKVIHVNSVFQNNKYTNPFQAQEMETSNYIIPVHWKFLRLDQDKDGILSKVELDNFKQMLNPTENCITDFLKSCDVTKNQSLTRLEWATCLKLTSEESDLKIEI